jgi:hypothetical protein
MSKLLLPFKAVTLPGLALGVVSTIVVGKWGRPALVGTLRLGFEAADGIKRVVHEAREEASGLVAEAKAAPAAKAQPAAKAG